MKTRPKTPAEIRAMRESGSMLGSVLKFVSRRVVPGISTKELANIAAAELKVLGGTPAFLGYHGFPDVICISINDEIVHGIPSFKRVLKSGDIVSLDFGVSYEKMLTDSALSMIVGDSKKPEHERLLKITEMSLMSGIDAVHNNVRVGDIGAAIESVLKPGGYGIPRDLVGHGIGSTLWEEPNIPNFGNAGTGQLLVSGMTIAIEPMVTLGTYRIQSDLDGWTIRTADGSMAAHFEHTVLIIDDGVEILTER